MEHHDFPLMNVRDAAAFLAVHPNTVRRWAQANKLPGRRLGARGDWRFTREDLADMPLAPAVAPRNGHANGAQPPATRTLGADDPADVRSYEARARTMFDLVPVAVYACDAAGVIQDYNQRAVELWGRAPERGDPRERFCGSFKLFSPMAHPCPTINARWRGCCGENASGRTRRRSSSGGSMVCAGR